MSDEIIARVRFIATKQKQPNGLTFTRMDGTPMLLVDDDDDKPAQVEIVKPENVIIDEVHDETTDGYDTDEPPPTDYDFIDAVEDLDDLPTEGGLNVTNDIVEPDGETGVTVQDVVIDNNDGKNDIVPDTIEPTNMVANDNNNRKIVSWTDLSADNIITNGNRKQQPRKRDKVMAIIYWHKQHMWKP
jgi:hypothetical protein